MTDPINDTRADRFERALPPDLSREIVLSYSDRLLNQIAKNSPAWRERISFLKSENLPQLRRYALFLSNNLPEETCRAQKAALLAIGQPKPSIGPEQSFDQVAKSMIDALKQVNDAELTHLQTLSNSIAVPIGGQELLFLAEMDRNVDIANIPTSRPIKLTVERLAEKGFFDRAIAAAHLIDDRNAKHEAFNIIARELINKDFFVEALEIANLIPEAHSKSQILANISIGLVKKGLFTEAAKTLHRIPNDSIKEEGLINISLELAKMGLLERALLAVKSLSHERTEEIALLGVSRELIKRGDFLGAEEVANLIRTPSTQILCFQEISIGLAKSDTISEAERVAHRINHEKKRDLTLRDIAEVLSQKDNYEGAKIIARTISSPGLKGSTLRSIKDREGRPPQEIRQERVMALCQELREKRLSPESRELAKTVTIPNEREMNRQLRDLSTELSWNGYYPEARQVANLILDNALKHNVLKEISDSEKGLPVKRG